MGPVSWRNLKVLYAGVPKGRSLGTDQMYDHHATSKYDDVYTTDKLKARADYFAAHPGEREARPWWLSPRIH